MIHHTDDIIHIENFDIFHLSPIQQNIMHLGDIPNGIDIDDRTFYIGKVTIHAPDLIMVYTIKNNTVIYHGLTFENIILWVVNKYMDEWILPNERKHNVLNRTFRFSLRDAKDIDQNYLERLLQSYGKIKESKS